jgi:SPP1 gp7 family putative phage head morphogenesis protein
MSTYWQDRMAQSQSKITSKSAKQIERQMRKYYSTSLKRTIKDFEDTYTHLKLAVKDGREPTPADLYNLDKYWQMQAQMQKELQKLGDKQIRLLGKNFEANFFEVYYSIALEGMSAFNTIDSEMVQQMINQVWVADGKSWSARIWDNTAKLAETLNEELINCVVNGNKTSDLKKKLLQRFNVSYSQADSLARTELAHIQTQAAQKRYEDYGVEMFEVWADEDERRCEICGKLHQKKFPASALPPIPAHPRCRCCIVPVIK